MTARVLKFGDNGVFALIFKYLILLKCRAQANIRGKLTALYSLWTKMTTALSLYEVNSEILVDIVQSKGGHYHRVS